jgi:3-deoxy-D-manno-octulosonic-acid transferase
VYALYSALLFLLLLLSLPYWLLQMARLGKYRAGLAERLGQVPERLHRDFSARPVIWVHAVSVGEVLAVSTLLEQLRAEGASRVVISTTTQTGQRLARQRFGEENVFYFPIDLPISVGAYLRALKPKVVVLAETEFWPNFLHKAHRSGARVIVVNARISDRSFPGYRRFRHLLRHVLSNVDQFLAQSEEDARRLVEIGAAADRVEVSGNLKFDVAPPRALPFVEELRAQLAAAHAGPTLVAGSTVDGEEQFVLSAFREVLARNPQARLILAPRHRERFASVAALLAQSGMPFALRSEARIAHSQWRVLLLDSIGELATAYSLADVALVGGSLVPRGGHNILEPAFYGVPIIVGPHTENFRDIIALFRRENAVIECAATELTSCLQKLFSEKKLRTELGTRASSVLQAQRGATTRTHDAIRALLAGAGR